MLCATAQYVIILGEVGEVSEIGEEGEVGEVGGTDILGCGTVVIVEVESGWIIASSPK